MSEAATAPSASALCGATIEKEWKGHRVVLSRRRCRNRTMIGYEHCHYHLTYEERIRRFAEQMKEPVYE